LDLLLGARDLVKHQADVRVELQSGPVTSSSTSFRTPIRSSRDPSPARRRRSERDDWTRARPVPGKLFVVGDPKQSIYRFRRAEVALYQAVKNRLLAQGASLLHLVTSFRSAPSIQKMVNARSRR